MTKDVWILILGLFVAALPHYSGFPVEIEKIVFTAAGLLIAVLAFLMRGDFSLFHMERSEDTYVESSGESRNKKEVMSDGIAYTRGTEADYEEETDQHS